MKKRAGEKIKFHSYEQVFKTKGRTRKYWNTYNEETARLNLAMQIRTARTKKKLTQQEVAKRSGMPQSVIARVEGGEHSVTLTTLAKVAHALGKKVNLT